MQLIQALWIKLVGEKLAYNCRPYVDHPFLYKGMTVAIFSLPGNIPAPGDWLIMWARGAAITGLIVFNSLEDMPSTSQPFVTERSDIILCTAVPSMHWNSNEDIIFCFMYVLILFGVLQCILCDKSLPKLAKNELKLDAISCFEFVLFPLIIKTFGN